MFEAIQFVEVGLGAEAEETSLGEYEEETAAVEAARAARLVLLSNDSEDYAWWIVRKKGARLANFIADSKSNKEFVLDLRSGELIEVTP